MSCSLPRLPSQQAEVYYVGCQMTYTPDRTGRTCINKHDLDVTEVEGCHVSEEGLNLQLVAEQKQIKTLPNGYPSFVPTIVANDQFSQTLQNALLNDFKNTVCQLIDNAADVC